MQTTKQLLDRAKKAQGIESDYRLAQVLGVAKTAITNYRSGRNHPNDEIAARLADLAGQDPSSVIAELYAERAKTPAVRDIWLRMAKQIRHGVAAVMLAVGTAMILLAPSPQGAQATQLPASSLLGASVDYVKRRLGRIGRFARSRLKRVLARVSTHMRTRREGNEGSKSVADVTLTGRENRAPYVQPRPSLPAVAFGAA